VGAAPPDADGLRGLAVRMTSHGEPIPRDLLVTRRRVVEDELGVVAGCAFPRTGFLG